MTNQILNFWGIALLVAIKKLMKEEVMRYIFALTLLLTYHCHAEDEFNQVALANSPIAMSMWNGMGQFANADYWKSWLITTRNQGLTYIPGMKKAAYEYSLSQVLRNTQEPKLKENHLNDRWNVVATNKQNGAEVILGMIPLKNHNHLARLKNEYGVQAVLTLLENFEQEPGWFEVPVSQSDWQENGIENYHVPTADYNPLSIENITNAVMNIEHHWQRGETTYVHCKAGVGRSATVVAAWLSLHRLNNKTLGFYLIHDDEALKEIVDEVINEMMKIRTINLQSAQKYAVVEYLKSFREKD